MCDSQVVENTDAEGLSSPLAEETREPINKALVVRLVLAALIVAVFVIFAAQNTERVTIEFLSWSFQLSQFLMMLLSAVAGVVIWQLAGAYSRRAKRKRS